MRVTTKASRLIRAVADSNTSPVRLFKIFFSRIWLDTRIFEPIGGIIGRGEHRGEVKSEKIKVGIYIHLFHEDYLETFFDLADSIGSTSILADFFVTTSSSRIADRIRSRDVSQFKRLGITVAICQNRGRNFGPLFIEFANTFNQYDYCIHLHSKKSEQIARKKSESWALTNWRFLGINTEALMRAINLMQDHTNISLAFAWNRESTPLSAFTWGLNKKQGQWLASNFATRISRELVVYPVGGMFLARGEFLANFSQHVPFKYDDYPKESGQVDGCLQHAVERALGFASEALGDEVLIFDENSDLFFLGSELRQQLGQAWL